MEKPLGDGEKRRRELLRKALGFVLPEKNATDICLKLLNVYGSFDGVFNAPEPSLRAVPGVGEKTVEFLKTVLELSRLCMEERSWNLVRVNDTDTAAELFKPKFLGERDEIVCLMLVDARGRAVYNDVICEGSLTEVPVRLRNIIGLCIEYGVSDVFIAHNHPSGLIMPSENDVFVTAHLIHSLAAIDANLCDHIIFAGENYYSFAHGGLLQKLEKLMGDSIRSTANVARETGKMIGEGKNPFADDQKGEIYSWQKS